jgi:hypothetical protein
MLAAPANLAKVIEELRACLWASADAPPLTLEACAAIDSAQRGSCVLAGGSIEAFELEALITRFADDGAGLVRLTPLPAEKKLEYPLRECLFRFVVTPEWLQHRYGFIELE